MSRNEELHFMKAPEVNIPRSTFTMNQNIRTTFNMGDLVPFYVDLDVLPGDTFQFDMAAVIRQSTPIYPTMDNSFLDTYFFAIPWRLIWQHTKEFFGENKSGAWTQTTEYVIPQLTTPAGGAAKGTLMDYMGIPTNVEGIPFSALGIRAYVLTYNEHFRDQNLIAPITEYTDDTDRTASNTVTELGGVPCKAAKFHDYFTSCLPQPQKGNPVSLPIGTEAPVKFDNSNVAVHQTSFPGIYTPSGNLADITRSLPLGTVAGKMQLANANFTGVSAAGFAAYTDLSQAVAATINAQRMAFATQRILEKDARGGTRYVEVIKNHFHVTSPDARQQRPEYLGGKRLPITMQQVPQTSSTDTTSPQGNLAAFSHTVDADRAFTKSFTEHTIILGLCVARQQHSYNQGLNRMWSRRRRLDLYWPSLAHLGEQAVLNKEIYAQGNTTDTETFGFQERWAEYKYKPNLNTGAFRTTYAQSLDSWHYGDDYASLPGLAQPWIEETKDYLDRTLAVKSSVEDQYLADILLKIKATRPMPLYSVPGLIDHY